MEVDILSTELGALFLLRRAGLLPADATLGQAETAEQVRAKAICEELGGLPLALDQAGAYIEETGCSLSDYQRLYQRRRADLLGERRGQLVDDHPLPVATTWSLSFQNVEQKNPAAADLLRLCAFLAPDAIPEEIVTQGAEHLGPQLAPVGADPYLLNRAIEALRAYSLLRRKASSGTVPLLSVHRLVQVVILNQMDERNRQQWAERAVRAVSRVFPEVEFTAWQRCQRYLPHSQVCATLIEQWSMTFAEAAQLLDRVGNYLRIRAQYKDAEPLLTQALSIREQTVGLVHPDVATSLSDLARLYKDQGKYEYGEQFFTRALTMLEQIVGPDHSDVAISLSELAWLYHDQRKYEQAELLFKRALTIRERTAGLVDHPHPDVATSLTDPAWLYKDQGKYEQAEEFFRRVLAMREQIFGPIHPDVATSLTDLAWLYYTQARYTQAELLFKRALAIREQQLGPDHPDTATSLNNLAELYRAQGKYEQAEPFFRRALAIREQTLGETHPDTANSVWSLAVLSKRQQQYEQAASFYQRAFSIFERTLGPQHPTTQRIRADYASLLRTMGREAEAKALGEGS